MNHPVRCTLTLSILAACQSAFAAPAALDATDTHTKTLATIEVVGRQDRKESAGGSTSVLDQSVLISSRALTVNEALRKVPGVTVRDEEGFGLRPNIGIRGSNPTRSTKVLLLEDGLPAMYAPYGDNASYYHAPIQRYTRIEVLKGAGLLRFGPQTITGAINYITPTPPQELAGHAQLSMGSRGLAALHTSIGAKGLLVDFGHKQGDGARDNTHLEQSDLFAKYETQLNETHAITFRANALRELSQVGYSGLTEAEARNFGAAYYPFENDQFDIRHSAFSASHAWTPREGLQLLTSGYYSEFLRDWWRQSSTTSDTLCGTAFRDARYRGERVDPNLCAANQGRLRNYYTWGLDTRLSFDHSVLGTTGSSELGLRWHEEDHIRYQINGSAMLARSGNVVENNVRLVEAMSAFATTTFDLGSVQLTPSLRHEAIDFTRTNRLSGGETGMDEVNANIWGLGANWQINRRVNAYVSAHEGFAPPRVEDLIAGNGTSTTVDAEQSINLEAGLRARFHTLDVEATVFHSSFDNQIVVGSIAGGSTPLAQGETNYRGIELALGFNRSALQTRTGQWYGNLASTWLPTAEQSTVLRRVDNGSAANGSVAGNRLPYAPTFTATARLGYAKNAWDASIEMSHVGAQWSDFGNTLTPAINGNGQLGRIASHAVWSATLNYEPQITGWNAFVTVKNLTDRRYIVDRTRGILFGNPRQIVVGLRWAF